MVDKNVINRGRTPTDGEGAKDFLDKLLLFSPYSPDTIVKAYDLSYVYEIATVVHYGLKDMYVIYHNR